MRIRIATQWFALLVASVLLGACGGQKQAAQSAIDKAEGSIAAIRDDAAKYVPDDFKDLEASLAGMKSNFAKGSYPAVLTASRELTTRIGAVTNALAAKKTETEAMTAQLTEQWNTLSVELPEMVEKITARVDSLTKSGKLPKDVDAPTFERIKTNAASMAQNWQQALGAFSNGNMQEAVDMAQIAREKGSDIMTTLGMTS